MKMPIDLAKRRLGQVLGILTTLFGSIVVFFSSSLLSGMISVNFGSAGPPLWFVGAVFGGVPLGIAIAWAGVKLVSWGMRAAAAD